MPNEFRSSNKIESNHVDDEFGINMCFVFLKQVQVLTCFSVSNITYFEKKKFN